VIRSFTIVAPAEVEAAAEPIPRDTAPRYRTLVIWLFDVQSTLRIWMMSPVTGSRVTSGQNSVAP